MNSADFRDLVSGRRRGLSAACLRAGLRLAETPYSLAMRLRNLRYDLRPSAATRVSVPVISVGNLTLGGTGKTPMVEWLARWLRARGVRVTIVSRGYGAEQGSLNDEALELEQKLPDVPHLQNPDRVAAAQLAIEKFACQCVLLDDGFQHRRIARDLDLVLIDALEPFGYGHVFPRGMLREPLSGLGRAQVVALSRANMVSTDSRKRIWDRVRQYAPQVVRIEVAHVPQRLLSVDLTAESLDRLPGERVAAFCGIGNPAGFHHTLSDCGATLVDFREFPDHHAYSRQDVDDLSQWAGSLDVNLLLCTHKDLVKLGIDRLGKHPLLALSIGMEVLSGQGEFEAKLLPLVSTDRR